MIPAYSFASWESGPDDVRVDASESYWSDPLKWDRAARKAGERRRVFCASPADVFEDWRGRIVNAKGESIYLVDGDTWWPNPLIKIGRDRRPLTMDDVRKRLVSLIQATPNLDWLLLTEHPENALPMLVRAELYTIENPNLPCPQPNLWIGAAVENQRAADARIPHLLRTPAAVRFLSVEPLLGPVDLSRWLHPFEVSRDEAGNDLGSASGGSDLDWVIVGGESGPGARPMHPQWARDIRDQCVEAGVAFHFKQWGHHSPFADERRYTHCGEERLPHVWVSRDGESGKCWIIDDDGTWSNWTGDPPCRVDDDTIADVAIMAPVGKKASGRLLDGRTWDEFPKVAEAADAR